MLDIWFIHGLRRFLPWGEPGLGVVLFWIGIGIMFTRGSVDTLLGIATAPLLAGLLGGKALADVLKEWGQASEEIFRGDRLPILKTSPAPDSPESPDTSS